MKGRRVRGVAVASLALALVAVSGQIAFAGQGQASHRKTVRSRVDGLGIQSVAIASQYKLCGLGIQSPQAMREQKSLISFKEELVTRLLSILLSIR